MDPLQVLIQGTPYGIMAVGLVTIWTRYQAVLTEKDRLYDKHAEVQQKLIEMLLSKVDGEDGKRG